MGNLKTHVKKIHQIPYEACSICFKQVDIRKMEQHRELFHVNSTCIKCQKEFCSIVELRKHVKNREGFEMLLQPLIRSFFKGTRTLNLVKFIDFNGVFLFFFKSSLIMR